MKRFLMLFLMTAITLTGCDELKPKPSGPTTQQQTNQAPPAVEEHKTPPSIEEMEGKLTEIKDKLQNTENLLIKRTAERDTAKSELGQIIRRSNKTPKEIKAELAKVKSDLDSQQWFQEVRSAWSKLTALERDVVVFTRQEDRLNKSKHQLEQSLETLRRIEENNRVYIQGEDPELDRLIAEGDVTIQDEEWDEMSTGEKTEIALEVDKIMAETMENNVTKIQKLELKSVKGLSPLPDLAEKVQTPETTAEKSLLVRVKNDCNRITERANKEFEECVQDKQLDAACLCRLETIQQLQKNVANATDNFAKDFFTDYQNSLDSCRNETLLVMSKPFLQALSLCVKDMEIKDPDWKTIAESLEGLLRIKPTQLDPEIGTQMEIIRSHFEYLLKQKDRNALITQERLKSILDKIENTYFKERYAFRCYVLATQLYERKEYSDALEKVQAALDCCPTNEDYLLLKTKIKSFGFQAGTRKVLTVDGVAYAFRWCPPGEFIMGDDYNSHPAHKVVLTKGFWLLETEVTQEMWKSMMGNNPSNYGEDLYPVTNVNWNDCQEFCQNLSEKLGRTVKLPTEAQWEYACRAGTTDDYAGDLNSMAWYGGQSDHHPHEVGLKKPNAWFLYDMHGNVEEFCSDWYDLDFYKGSPTNDPENTKASEKYVVRGGSYFRGGYACKSRYRDSIDSDEKNHWTGFRVLLVAGPGE